MYIRSSLSGIQDEVSPARFFFFTMFFHMQLRAMQTCNCNVALIATVRRTVAATKRENNEKYTLERIFVILINFSIALQQSSSSS